MLWNRMLMSKNRMLMGYRMRMPLYRMRMRLRVLFLSTIPIIL